MKTDYKLKGNRVSPLSFYQVREMAELMCKAYKLKKGKKLKLDTLLDSLSYFKIELDIVEDSEWLEVTSGCYNPNTGQISLPNFRYVSACKGNTTDMHIVFHEIGHALLGHKSMLHYSTTPPIMQEDAEWQADCFADSVFFRLGISKYEQLDLFTGNEKA